MVIEEYVVPRIRDSDAQRRVMSEFQHRAHGRPGRRFARRQRGRVRLKVANRQTVLHVDVCRYKTHGVRETGVLLLFNTILNKYLSYFLRGDRLNMTLQGVTRKLYNAVCKTRQVAASQLLVATTDDTTAAGANRISVTR